jgi:hypothetical protein
LNTVLKGCISLTERISGATVLGLPARGLRSRDAVVRPVLVGLRNWVHRQHFLNFVIDRLLDVGSSAMVAKPYACAISN